MIQDTVFGLHAVEALAVKEPESILEIKIQQGREDSRLNKLLNLLQTKSISYSQVPRKDLDKLVSGRHQGVVAIVKAEPVKDEQLEAQTWFEKGYVFKTDQSNCMPLPPRSFPFVSKRK